MNPSQIFCLGKGGREDYPGMLLIPLHLLVQSALKKLGVVGRLPAEMAEQSVPFQVCPQTSLMLNS